MMPEERYIEFDLTYKCSAQCRHCILVCSPKKGGLMTLEDAHTYLLEMKKLGLSGSDLIITGGEALLYFERVLEIIRCAADLDMTPVRSIQSNGSWCVNDKLTRQRLTDLHEAGLQGIYFSVDPFHNEFVPFENVQRGIAIAEEIFGRDHVAVSSRNYLNAERIPTAVEYLEGVEGPPAIMTGRAAWALPDYLKKAPLDQILGKNCRGGSNDIDPSSVWQINVDAYGCVSSWICSGILLGNAHETPLSQILTRPLTDQPQIVQDLVAHGPGCMLGMAKKHGFQPAEGYVTKCHLCWDIRTAIHMHYPGLFAPAELYRD